MTMDLIEIKDNSEVLAARSESSKMLQHAIMLASKVTDDAGYNAACDFLMEIKRRRKWWEGFNRPEKQQIDRLKRMILDREQQIDEPWARAEQSVLKPAIGKFEMERDRKRREAEDRLRDEARKRAEDEKLAQAAELEKMGEKEAAQRVIEQPIAPATAVLPKIEQPKGVSFREVWKFEVIDPIAVPADYKIIDESKIRKVVGAFKAETKIPGIRVWSEREPVLRV